jgi:three-Cys-motif partner protein
LATGTAGGLLDDSDGHAQSVFKHEILRQYMPPFISMLGSASHDRRVVVLDGYAGRGRYDDDKPASAELILQAIQSLSASRRPTAFFVERKSKDYGRLARVVAEYACASVPAQALRGGVEDHLETVLAAAAGVPLFMFLDPCGAALPFDQLAGVLQGPRRFVRPQTEVLLNFSADLTRRTAGVLRAGQLEHGGLKLMDRTCGGSWWRDTAQAALVNPPRATFEPVAAAVAEGYASRLALAGSMIHVVVPVRRQVHHQPIYYLVFLTRSSYGLWVFADAIGNARKAWLRKLGATGEDEADLVLLSRADLMEGQIENEAERAVSAVVANVRGLVNRCDRPVKLVDYARDVFRGAYGVATDASVAIAVARLADGGEVTLLNHADARSDAGG